MSFKHFGVGWAEDTFKPVLGQKVEKGNVKRLCKNSVLELQLRI